MRRLLAPLLLLAAVLPLGAGEHSLEAARRIDDFLVRIAAPRPAGLFLKKAAFSESEFNAYLNLIYVKKYAPEVTAIQMRLKDENRVEGSLHVKLDGEKFPLVPQFLRETDVRFSGQFECSGGHMRVVLGELAINGSHFSPDALDEIYGAAQLGAKTRKSIFDWFSLLPGLKNVQSREKTILFFY